jgi:hypothetical protein
MKVALLLLAVVAMSVFTACANDAAQAPAPVAGEDAIEGTLDAGFEEPVDDTAALDSLDQDLQIN